ncbi:MAG: pyrroline-5-carboxylate reductase [Verrucomicrobia bacterium]|nr:MAG: pyrroline-5-carboxylate reductase [Verrucomicrobiota bacterium]
MASALVRGVLQAGVCQPEAVWASDCFFEAAQKLAADTGLNAVRSNLEVATASQTLLLCVKPQDALKVLQELGVSLAGKLVVSIAAGVSLAALESAAGAGVRIIRVMPNTPALVHKAATAYSPGRFSTPADAAGVEALFSAVGFVAQVKEPLLDAVTGLSGSGPAYAFLMIEALADGGVLMGLPRDLALKLAAQTLAGAAEMVLQTGDHPGKLRDAVASPGGTTIAGIEALEGAGVRAGLIGAVRKAAERSIEMGKA